MDVVAKGAFVGANVEVGEAAKRAADRANSVPLTDILDNKDGLCDAYVVFVDIVSYTRRDNTRHQVSLVKTFQRVFDQALTATAREFQDRLSLIQADLLRDVVIIPLGDGAAVAFPFPNLFDLPLYFAKRLFEEVHRNTVVCPPFRKQHWCNCHDNMKLRCGISFGTGILFRDVNNRLNVAGKPVNLASRLMDVADPGQIFVCNDFHERLSQLTRRGSGFRRYEAEVKHGLVLPAYQYCEQYHYINTKRRRDLEQAAAARAAANLIGIVEECLPVPKLLRPSPRPACASLPTELRKTLDELETRLIPVPAGDFIMGDKTTGLFSVRLTHSFLIDCHPVTQRLYQAVMKHNPSHFHGENLPVECVTWLDAINFCNELSMKVGRNAVYSLTGDEVQLDLDQDGYRLLTEAEWEFCAVHDEEAFGTARIMDVAWCQANSQSGTKPVGQKRRQNSPLSDLLGNVWEWCWDRYGSYPMAPQIDYEGAKTEVVRVLRGGAWDNQTSIIGPRQRHWRSPLAFEAGIGFRVVRNQAN